MLTPTQERLLSLRASLQAHADDLHDLAFVDRATRLPAYELPASVAPLAHTIEESVTAAVALLQGLDHLLVVVGTATGLQMPNTSHAVTRGAIRAQEEARAEVEGPPSFVRLETPSRPVAAEAVTA